MFIKLFLFLIISYIITNEFFDNNKEIKSNRVKCDNVKTNNIKTNNVKTNNIKQNEKFININENNSSKLIHEYNDIIIEAKFNDNNQPEEIEIKNINEPENNIQEFDRPYPWTKIIYDKGEEYPYMYHIKIIIPSLNDFERWKQIIPNIDFNPNSRELIIPSKDEASALAIANLICINFSGQMSMTDILNKDLIRISISKAKTHDVVKNKLREQIMEVLYGKSFNTIQTNYEKDLAKNGIEQNNSLPNKSQSPSPSSTPTVIDNKPMTLTSENFRDTFHHFSDNQNNNEIDAFDNSNYSFL